MKLIFSLIKLLCFTLISSCAYCFQELPLVIEEVKRTEKLLQEATLKSDTLQMSRYMSKDFIFIHSTGAAESRQHYLENAKNGRLMVQRSEIETLNHEVRIFNNTTAIVIKKGRAFNRKDSTYNTLRNAAVFVKVNGQWIWASGQSTKLPVRPKATITINEKAYNLYVGSYRINEKRSFTIVKDKDKLYLKGLINMLPQDELIPQTETVFIRFNEDNDFGDSKIIFTKDSSGKVTHASYLSDGVELWSANKTG
jgi:hypothetical protein